MKKLMIVICLFLIILFATNQNSFSLLDYFSGDYTIYTSNSSGEDSVNLGFCYTGDKKVSSSVLGESIEIKNLEVGDALKTLNAKVVKTETLEDFTTVIYAYSNLIPKNVTVFGQNVNLQIAIKDDTTIIGWPLILGSF